MIQNLIRTLNSSTILPPSSIATRFQLLSHRKTRMFICSYKSPYLAKMTGSSWFRTSHD